MEASRRALLAGVGAAAFIGSANAQVFGGRNDPAPVAGAYGPAAEYAAARRGVSLLVMQHGKILFEHYPSVGAPEKGWELASGTKSFTGVMAALASADGMLDIDELKRFNNWAIAGSEDADRVEERRTQQDHHPPSADADSGAAGRR